MKSLSEPCGTNLSFCAKCLTSTDTAHFPSFKLILYFKDRTASLFEVDYYPFRHLTLLSMQLTAKKTHLTCLLLTLNMTALYNENAYTGLCVSQIIITECRPVLWNNSTGGWNQEAESDHPTVLAEIPPYQALDITERNLLTAICFFTSRKTRISFSLQFSHFMHRTAFRRGGWLPI